MYNERLREALPFLRLRTEEPEPFVWFLFVLLCVGITAVFLLHILRNRRCRLSHMNALTKRARKRGLSPDETALLQVLGRDLYRPVRLVESAYLFNQAVATYLDRLLDEEWDHPHSDQLFSIRHKLKFDKVAPGKPLRSTRELPEGLTLMVWHTDRETNDFFTWILVERDERGLTIVPLLKDDFAHFTDLHVGMLLALRFWHSADTEYRMELEVHVIKPSEHALTLRHSNQLERLQLRDFYRLDVHFPLSFFAAPPEADTQGRGEGEREVDDHAITSSLPRIESQVLDLSAGGLSVEIRETTEEIGERLLIDPNFNGAFSLAGLYCEKVGEESVGDSLRVQLRFADMSEERRADLVRQVYAHQMHLLQSD